MKSRNIFLSTGMILVAVALLLESNQRYRVCDHQRPFKAWAQLY